MHYALGSPQVEVPFLEANAQHDLIIYQQPAGPDVWGRNHFHCCGPSQAQPVIRTEKSSKLLKRRREINYKYVAEMQLRFQNLLRKVEG